MTTPIIRTGTNPKVVLVPSGNQQTIAVGEEPVTVTPSEDNPVLIQPIGGKAGPAGPIGPTGPVGPSGSAASGVTWNQAVPASVWTIPHDLGYPPSVTVIDTSGAQVEGDAVLGPDLVTLTFSAAFGGTAYLS